MEKKMKSTYVAPSIEVIPMEMENVIALSNGGNYTPSESRLSRPKGYSRSASSSELEDLINDILTVEQ